MLKSVLSIFSLAGLAIGISNAQSPTWATDIASIIYSNCTGCHISGGIAPFSLVGYSQAKPYSNSIKQATQARRMPPWPADPNYTRHAFERLLSTEEIQSIADWVDAGSPSGDLNLSPSDPQPKLGSSIVSPTYNLKAPDYNINTTVDEYRCFVLPMNLTADAFVTEMEVVPGNRTAVHHVLVFADTSKIPEQLDSNDPKPGYLRFGGTGSSTSTLLGIWVPGGEPFKLPSGMGMQILKGSKIILQIHYPANIFNEWDSTRVVIKTSSNFLRNVYVSPILDHGVTLQNGPLIIGANKSKSFWSKFDAPRVATVFAVFPHMHLIGKSMKVYGITPTLDTQKFINIPNWDFHWQGTYFFRNAMKIIAGTSFRAEAFYDNTANNPRNPNSPPKTMVLGGSTTDEMLLAYFWYTWYLPGDENIIIDPRVPKNISTAANPNIVAATIRLWPNPASDKLQVELPGMDERVLGFYNSLGTCVKMIKCHGSVIQIDIADLVSGLYYVKSVDGTQVYFGKFVKN